MALGVYLKFFYDVPDAREAINFFVSGFFIIIGFAGLAVNLFWTPPRRDEKKED